MLKYIVYILHFVFHEDALIYWGQIISNEILFQLEGLRKTRKFYTNSYLVYDIAYCHIFEDFPKARNVDFKVETNYVCYLVLWRLKAKYSFYVVQNGFMYFLKN
jgi:hypothetical protein